MSDSKTITKNDPEWTDFILEQLHEDELFDGVPRIEGLRRMVETYVSPIKSILSTVHPCDNGQTLTIIVTIEVHLENGQIYSASSDANMYSCIGEFRNRLTATADTRAKSKVYREILCLRNMFTTDEVIKTEDLDEDSLVAHSQKMLINKKSAKLDIDISKLMDHILGELAPKNLDSLKQSQAVSIMGALDDYDKERKGIPKEIKL